MLDPQVIDLRHRHCAQASDLGQHTWRRLVSRALRTVDCIEGLLEFNNWAPL
jgi:hypothetical protein